MSSEVLPKATIAVSKRLMKSTLISNCLGSLDSQLISNCLGSLDSQEIVVNLWSYEAYLFVKENRA